MKGKWVKKYNPHSSPFIQQALQFASLACNLSCVLRGQCSAWVVCALHTMIGFTCHRQARWGRRGSEIGDTPIQANDPRLMASMSIENVKLLVASPPTQVIQFAGLRLKVAELPPHFNICCETSYAQSITPKVDYKPLPNIFKPSFTHFNQLELYKTFFLRRMFWKPAGDT